MISPLYITANQIKKYLSIYDLVDAMDEAFKLLHQDNSIVPQRINLNLIDKKANVLIMPVYIPNHHFYIIKRVGIHPLNKSKGLDNIHADIEIVDANNGKLIAVADGEVITGMRTAAASIYATKKLMKNVPNEMFIIGFGKQAKYHMDAFYYYFNMAQFHIISNKKVANLEFDNPLNLKVKDASQKDLRYARLILLATNSNKAVISRNDLPNEFHMNAIGSYKSDMAEFDETFFVDTRIFVDSLSSAIHEAGEIVYGLKHNFIKDSNLTEIASNFMNQDKRTIFKTVGNAIQDFFAVKILLKSFSQFL